MKFASWVPNEIKEHIWSEDYDSRYIGATGESILSSEHFGKQWSSLVKEIQKSGKTNNHVDILLYLEELVDRARRIPKYELITPSERIAKSDKFTALVKQITPLLDEFNHNFSSARYLPFDALEFMLDGIIKNIKLEGPSLLEEHPEIGNKPIPLVSNILEDMSNEIKNKASDKSLIPAPNTQNYKEIYFIRTLYKNFYQDLNRTLIPVIEDLVSLFFPTSNLNYVYIKDCIDRYKRSLS